MPSTAPPNIPGTQIPHHDAEGLKHDVAGLLGRENTRFPGAQPVSFAKHHLTELQQQEYFMCEKTDGVRCLLYLTYIESSNGFEPATILIDRKNNYYDVRPPLRYPYYNAMDQPEAFLYGTLLDGELVHDRYPNEVSPRLIYYVFDCMAIDSVNFTGKPLDKRIGVMKEQMFKPYHYYLHKHNQQPPAPQPFRVKEKELFPPYSFKAMFANILPRLPHGNDGLVFTCKATPYEFGTDKHILKWKPPHENTIDFKLKLGNFPLFDPEDGEEGPIEDYDAMPDRFELHIYHGNNDYRPYAQLHITPQDWEILKSLNEELDGRIIECFRDEQGRWRYKREDDGTPRWRDDKKDANHISTVNSVLDSINQPVTEQDLLSAEETIRASVKRLQAHEREQKALAEREAKKRKFSEVNGAP